MSIWIQLRSQLCWLIVVCLSAAATAQDLEIDLEIDPDNVEVSYIYAAVMGTGSYKIDGRRISMLEMPFSWTQREMTDTSAGFKWYMPVVIGHDNIDWSDGLDEFLPNALVTVTVLPGFEYQMRLKPGWIIKPFGHVGLTHDFVTHEVVVLGVLGLSSLSQFDFNHGWELRWGNKMRISGEYQFKSESRTNFGMLETGVDIRKGTGLMAWGHEIDIGTYYIYQYFLPEWGALDEPSHNSDVANVHELGLSLGLKSPRKILGITFNRVRLGIKVGGDIRGFTIGGEFPF